MPLIKPEKPISDKKVVWHKVLKSMDGDKSRLEAHTLIEKARINMAYRRKGIKKQYIARNNIDEFRVKEIEDNRFKQLVDERVSLIDDNYLKIKKKTLKALKDDILENFQDIESQEFLLSAAPEIPLEDYVKAFR